MWFISCGRPVSSGAVVYPLAGREDLALFAVFDGQSDCHTSQSRTHPTIGRGVGVLTC